MNRDLEFLYEIGMLRLIPRQWQRFHFMNVQNLAEHHFRVTWLALIIAARENKKVSTEKIMKMALAHDIAESRTGDVDYIARQYVTRDEAAGLQDMLADTSLEKEFLSLIEEYEARESLEARIVKDADNLDVDMELMEQASTGSTRAEEWKANRQYVGANKLYTNTAKDMHKAIWASSPHDWHNNSPKNRLKGGDWKREEQS